MQRTAILTKAEKQPAYKILIQQDRRQYVARIWLGSVLLRTLQGDTWLAAEKLAEEYLQRRESSERFDTVSERIARLEQTVALLESVVDDFVEWAHNYAGYVK